MTTNVKTEPENTTTEQPIITNNTVTTTDEQSNQTVTPQSNLNESLLQEMKNMFDASIKELKDSFDKKTEELTTTIQQKEAEIEKLKQANINLALSGNFGNNNNGAADYNSLDFDEVDWNPQAKSCLDNIDAKIFDIKHKNN